MKKLERNDEVMLQSALSSLQIAYSEYRKAQINYLDHTCIGSDGEFIVNGSLDYYTSMIRETEKIFEERKKDYLALKYIIQTDAFKRKKCTDCILDGTDACSRGAGRAVYDEICKDFLEGE